MRPRYKMAYAVGILLAILLVGGMALPPLRRDDVSQFFDHSDSTGRILGGTNAEPVPYMVALSSGLISRSFLCGGSIIGRRHVLTAAHCIAGVFFAGSLSDSLRGSVGTDRWNSGGTHYNFARNITHPNYLWLRTKNDIGLLITTADIALTNNVQLATLNYDFIGADVATTVYGWGRVVQGGQGSATLQQLHKNIFDGARCVTEVARLSVELNVPAPDVEPHIEICTFHSVNHGTCHGDSGGPLVLRGTNRQIGIVSWGLPCALGAPDVFVRVSAFSSWLQSHL